MKRIVLLVVLCLSAFILNGCASSKMGTEFNSENVSKIEIGKTTEQEVIQLIGHPLSRSRSGDGTITLMYMYHPGETIHPFSVFNPNSSQNIMKGHKELRIIIGSDGKVADFSETSY